MSRDYIDEANLQITGAHKQQQAASQNYSVHDDVEIVVTQAFGPKGHNLVGISDVKFDGHPAVTVGVRVGDREGLVHLSPIHGDRRKSGFIDIEPGTRCELFCPISKAPLDRVLASDDGGGAEYFALYLTPKLNEGAMVAISNLWDHYNSRIIDNFELISMWAAEHEAA